MNNLEITVCLIAIAVAQVLTILLTIGRERDIKALREHLNELRAHLDEQRLRIVELRAWLAGRSAAQPSRIKSESEPLSEPITSNIRAPEPVVIPKDLAETIQPRTTVDEAAQAMKAQDWSREIVAGLRAGLKGGAPEPAITPKDLSDTIRPGATEGETKAFRWFKGDADEPREIVEAREIVAGLKGGAPPEPGIAPKDLPDTIRPSTAEDELKRATKAINWLKEDADKARENIASLHATPPEKKTG
jgi:hypothetical protein